MSYKVIPSETPWDATFYIVGSGGTGGFVAEGLCRLLANTTRRIILIDPDIVEPANLRRQNFYPSDLGKFKAKVLADRLSRLYGMRVGYSNMPFDSDMLNDQSWASGWASRGHSIVLGCVDNAGARLDIHRTVTELDAFETWWIDAGNGDHFGQVLVGNTANPRLLVASFNEKQHTVSRLPAPSLQNPNLLIPPAVSDPRGPDCAEAVEEDTQSPVINQTMASIVLNTVYLLLRGELEWMGAYLDMKAGTMTTVPADPRAVARSTGVEARLLMDTPANRRSIYA